MSGSPTKEGILVSLLLFNIHKRFNFLGEENVPDVNFGNVGESRHVSAVLEAETWQSTKMFCKAKENMENESQI